MKGGLTKFALRSWHDFNNIVPSKDEMDGAKSDDMYFFSAEQNSVLAPLLVVTYHLPTPQQEGPCKFQADQHNSALKEFICNSPRQIIGNEIKNIIEEIHK